MALIRCSECGRTISDRAESCVGCGAPVGRIAGFEVAPRRDDAPPPTPRRLFWRAVLSTGALLLGIVWAGLRQRSGAQVNRIGQTLAALLIIAGICGLIATALHQFAAWRNRR